MSAAKTLYTARFYETPSSSESTRLSSSRPQPSAYLDSLSKTHVALNHMEEVPDSRPATPDEADNERLEVFRAKVTQAIEDTRGNPASGKWGILADLLQTSMSKGKYRYMNMRTDVPPPKTPPGGWILAETEEEWFAWEKKRARDKKREEEELVKRQEDKKREEEELAKRQENQERVAEAKRKEEELLKEKVETWKRSVNADTHIGDDASHSPEPAGKKASSSRPSKLKSVPSDGPKPLSKSTIASRPPKSNARSIAELDEPFLPPSFPAGLETSTPPTTNRKKPSPIELVPSSSPLSSPTKKHPAVSTPSPKDVPNSSSKLSASQVPSSSPLSSPTKNTRVYGRPRGTELPAKRPRSPSPTPLVAKKTRSVASPPAPASGSGPSSSRAPSKPGSKLPLTPPRNTLPKLEDLIAASAKSKAKAKGKAKAKPKPKSPSPQPPSPRSLEEEEEPDEEERRRLDLEKGINVMEEDVINWEHTLENLTTKLVENAVASPSKSLSSIDDENSLESHNSMGSMPDFSHGAAFDPQGGSTQPMGLLESGESMGTTARGGFGQPDEFGFPMRYESQMDVESNMQGVDELLNQDVAGYKGSWMGQGPDDDDDDDDERRGGREGGQIDSSP
ncbi:hypothetical protein DFH07DRAFT_964955 [Mycena maculata]|uniref:Uncharacterized protein n=1 Tax=Mycena maculata TaxID=230809 RepID=A0AAD7N1E2_9AGAR|nr:hypothetical protein DFH07DRAFT_964955 [Mycena maculata]